MAATCWYLDVVGWYCDHNTTRSSSLLNHKYNHLISLVHEDDEDDDDGDDCTGMWNLTDYFYLHSPGIRILHDDKEEASEETMKGVYLILINYILLFGCLRHVLCLNLKFL